jgi:hypothetical protein
MRRSRRVFVLLSALTVSVPTMLIAACARRSGVGIADPAASPAWKALDAGSAATLLAVCRRLLPIRSAPQASFVAGVRALDELAAGRPEIARSLAAELALVRRELPARPDLDDVELDAYLESTRAAPLLAVVIPTALPAMLNDRTLWAAVGYEGESFSKGGYLRRGFDDLDWLDDPPAAVQGPPP